MLNNKFNKINSKEFYKLWLADLKLRLAIADDLRDEILLNYLFISHKNLYDNYYRKTFIDTDEWYGDEITKMACLHLAVTYFSNPDMNMEAGSVKDTLMIQRLIGSRMAY